MSCARSPPAPSIAVSRNYPAAASAHPARNGADPARPSAAPGQCDAPRRLAADPAGDRLDPLDLGEFMLGTGAGIGEACALGWSAVEFDAGRQPGRCQPSAEPRFVK